MKRLLLGALATVVWAGIASAADTRFPDWPCQQIKVPTLSVAAFWTGPSIASVGDAWQKDDRLHDLVLRLAARRTKLEEAEKAATDFVAGSPSDKQQRGALLFAGLFATLSKERSEVMDGIERFSRRQRNLRDELRTDLTALRGLQDAAQPDDSAIEKAGDKVAWDTRVFDERRQTIRYVCEVPGAIEHRLFALARAIQNAMN